MDWGRTCAGDEGSEPGEVNNDSLLDRLRVHPSETEPRDFIGQPVRGFTQRVFGGHLLAQSLLTVAAGLPPETVLSGAQMTFLRPGRSVGELRYRRESLREGRTVAAHRIEVRQDDRLLAVATITSSRNAITSSPDRVGVAMPEVPEPETLLTLSERSRPDGMRWRPRGDWTTGSRPMDVRYIDSELLPLDHRDQRCFWMRVQPIPGSDGLDENVQRALLGFASDRSLLAAISDDRRRRGANAPEHGATLEHGIMFTGAITAGEWMLFVQDSPVSSDSGGVARGVLHTRRNGVVAVATQFGVFSVR